MPITKIRKEPKVSASNVNVSPGQQLDDALTAIGAALDAKASAADVAAVTGNRSNLDTTDKTNLVAAINEVKGNIPTSYNELTDKPIVKTSDNGFVIVAQGANRANKATAQNAFAEGGNTEATGTSSHAEGFSTLAAGGSAHAEGQGTEASGTGSHAEGYSALARGAYSHVEGNYTETVDSYAHAEGYNTAAYGIASHAEGYSMWSNRVVSRAYAAGDSYIYVNREVNPGFVISNNTQTVGVQSCVLQEQGDYRLSLGVAFTEDIAANEILSVAPSAYGSYSHIEGSYTVAMGTASHAEGNLSKALGDYSHAEGHDTKTTNTAEHASGKYNKSTPNVTQFSVGIGADEEHRANAYEVTTDGKMYVKGVGGYDGTNVSATGVKALGEAGWISISIDDIADVSKVSGNFSNSYAFGDATIDVTESPAINGAFAVNTGTVSGDYSFAEGKHTTASGTAAHAEGDDTEASGGASHAEGYRSEATADCAHAEGRMTHATANAAHAEGQFTSANGKQSHAEGSNSLAGADISHAEGYNTKTLGECSHAEGWNTFTRNKGEHACGRYNFSTTDVTLFSIGCGDEGQSGASTTSQNAFEVDVNGNIYIKGIGNYNGMNIGQSGVESVQEVIARLVQALGGNNS